jgi:cold shock protein
MNQGTCKFWNSNRGYGFLERQGAPDIFVHVTGLAGGRTELTIGDEVEFNVASDRKTGKEMAAEVRVIG